RKKKPKLFCLNYILKDKLNQTHRLYNPGDKTIRFQVNIFPEQGRFLECMAINYGWQMTGCPITPEFQKKPDHFAFLLIIPTQVQRRVWIDCSRFT
ncbi:MAG: hypothetical protein ACHQFX_21750, partial [Chitinophagales bacterium]